MVLDAIRRSECRTDYNCKAWPKTSCGKDPVDGQRRCLCADQTHPINDDCITSPQGNDEFGGLCKMSCFKYLPAMYSTHWRRFTDLGMPCERDIQCIQLAHCTHNISEPHTDIKICQCREEFADDDGTCSSEWIVYKQIT